jgi:type I restriction enzyme M protein
MGLHPDVVSERVMSNVYEYLIRKFGTSVNEKAGEFMTPRAVVRLVTKLVLHTDEAIFTQKDVIRTIYDPACGTAGFLSEAIAQIKEFNPHAKIVPFGQKLDPETHALAMTAMMIQGFETDKIKQGSTLSNDQLPGEHFHYGLANPPFGFKWGKDHNAVTKERQALGFAGRFGVSSPRINDGSMQLLQHLVSKMEAPEHGGGRVGIVLSDSPVKRFRWKKRGTNKANSFIEMDCLFCCDLKTPSQQAISGSIQNSEYSRPVKDISINSHRLPATNHLALLN